MRESEELNVLRDFIRWVTISKIPFSCFSFSVEPMMSTVWKPGYLCVSLFPLINPSSGIKIDTMWDISLVYGLLQQHNTAFATLILCRAVVYPGLECGKDLTFICFLPKRLVVQKRLIRRGGFRTAHIGFIVNWKIPVSCMCFVTPEIPSAQKDFLGMVPETYHEQTDDRYDHREDKSAQTQKDSIRATYSDLVGRIDRFLNGPQPPDSEVRKGTRSRVRESLQVIQTALQNFGYSINYSSLISVSMH